MKSSYLQFKDYLLQWWQAALVGFLLGIFVTQWYAYNGVIQDCKILGGFRIGNLAFGCQMSKV